MRTVATFDGDVRATVIVDIDDEFPARRVAGSTDCRVGYDARVTWIPGSFDEAVVVEVIGPRTSPRYLDVLPARDTTIERALTRHLGLRWPGA